MASVLFSAMRDEAPFVTEWVAYHRAIGFDRIVVVTNDCTDGTDDILDQMSQCGWVEHIAQQVPKDVSPQANAVAISQQKNILQENDWGLFLDSDEFLNIKLGSGRLQDLIEHLENKNLIGMLINWKIFGDNHHDRFPGAYISEDFTLCDANLEKTQFKTLFKKCSETVGFSKYLHLCALVPGKSSPNRFASPDGEVLSLDDVLTNARRAKWFHDWLIKGEAPVGVITGVQSGSSVAQINHYMVRDPYSFHIKSKRGRGYKVAGMNDRHNDENYQKWNHNSATDTSILRWKEKTAELKADLRKTGQLSALDDKAQLNYAKGFEEFSKSTSYQFPMTFPTKEAAFVIETYRGSESILEYGSGGSTLLAARLGKYCVSVESDCKWKESISEEIMKIESRNLESYVRFIDIGITKEWGFPVNNRKYSNYWQYPLSIWTESDNLSPDCVLIDGRMRKACLLTVLAMTKRPVRVLFDDYYHRKRYRDVEAIIKPTRRVRRMAVFDVNPGTLSLKDFPSFTPWFFDMW